MSSDEDYWISKHAKRKQEIVSQLEKYIKVRNKTKIDILNLRFDHEINRLREELNAINRLLNVI
jgi:hypothetical protein